MNQNKKVNAAIVFWIKKFKQEKIPFGILKIQKFLWYAQILSWFKDKTFIFGDLEFEAWRYGPLNVISWKKWRTFLDPEYQKNSPDWELELIKKGNVNDLSEKNKERLNLIFEKKKNIGSWTLATETHRHKPYILARMKIDGITESIAKSFERLEVHKIDNETIKKFCRKIIEEYISKDEK